MAVLSVWQRWTEPLEQVPVVHGAVQRWYDRRFEHNTTDNLFRGVYGSFEAAAASAPPQARIGYDNPASAALYRRAMSIDPHDYPALLWLMLSVREGYRHVFDLGGSIGIKYYAFAKLIGYPADLRWTVCDVPAAVNHGVQLAEERGVSAQLRFTEDAGGMQAADLLYASGVVQYLPQRLSEMLAALPTKPRRLIINTAAIHPERSFFTLNSIGTAFCPYRVQALDAFCSEIEAQGYVQQAQWANVGKQLDLPLEPGCSLDRYMGFCFDRRA